MHPLLSLIPHGFSPSSIAMATKENITFQRGILKSIQTRVTTLASILLSFELFVLLYFRSVKVKMLKCFFYVQ